ncbi:MAG: arginyltransferase [Proteobacteria bacterium]|nr:arginyltransferase [Pseudomonadota bacterium]
MSTVSGKRLPLFLTPEHPCSYYADRQARTVFGDPRIAPDVALQSQLAQQGFRRSGSYIYRPECSGCHACIAARIDVAGFTASRSQRRNLRNNAALEVSVQRPWCDEALLAMYNRYQSHRHPDGQMVAPDDKQFREFLLSTWSDTRFLEIRFARELLGISVFDQLEDGFSAVYTFFEPDAQGRGLGVLAILKLVELAASEGLPWVYLGYWLPEHPKMDYKRHFRPLEILVHNEWRRLQFDKA